MKYAVKIVSPETELKNWIGGFFFTDAEYSFGHIRVIRKAAERQVEEKHRNFLGSGLNQYERARLFVELLMCNEFALKGLIFWFSREDESADQVYDMVRRISHDVYALASEAQTRASKNSRDTLLTPAEMATIKRASAFGVSVRYSLDAHLFFMQDIVRHRKMGEGHYSEMISDGLNELYEVNKKLAKFVSGLRMHDRVQSDPKEFSKLLHAFARKHSRCNSEL